jgi:hypothetical protein
MSTRTSPYFLRRPHYNLRSSNKAQPEGQAPRKPRITSKPKRKVTPIPKDKGHTPSEQEADERAEAIMEDEPEHLAKCRKIRELSTEVVELPAGYEEEYDFPTMDELLDRKMCRVL